MCLGEYLAFHKALEHVYPLLPFLALCHLASEATSDFVLTA